MVVVMVAAEVWPPQTGFKSTKRTRNANPWKPNSGCDVKESRQVCLHIRVSTLVVNRPSRYASACAVRAPPRPLHHHQKGIARLRLRDWSTLMVHDAPSKRAETQHAPAAVEPEGDILRRTHRPTESFPVRTPAHNSTQAPSIKLVHSALRWASAKGVAPTDRAAVEHK